MTDLWSFNCCINLDPFHKITIPSTIEFLMVVSCHHKVRNFNNLSAEDNNLGCQPIEDLASLLYFGCLLVAVGSWGT